MIRVESVKVLDGFQVRLLFTDGTEKTIDLSPYLRGPIFEPLKKDPAKFREVTVDPELGTIVWPNGADICPDVLSQGRLPASAEKAAR
jgi:hypothetical protein